ncbi:MAG: creatininase family protein, partial [Candidatus Bathyarchaeia archaeon]
LNGHGGQSDIINEAVNELKMDEKMSGIRLLYLSHFNVLPVELLAKDVPLKEDAYVHAEELETSLMLAVNPQIVKMKDAIREIPSWIPKGLTAENVKLVKQILKTKSIGKDTKTGVIGDPTQASALKGRKALRILSNKLAEIIKKEF